MELHYKIVYRLVAVYGIALQNGIYFGCCVWGCTIKWCIVRLLCTGLHYRMVYLLVAVYGVALQNGVFC